MKRKVEDEDENEHENDGKLFLESSFYSFK
jgi:hypothetical protein